MKEKYSIKNKVNLEDKKRNEMINYLNNSGSY
jgi:hypothetical protein